MTTHPSDGSFADIRSLRAEFPGAEQWHYFDVAARGLIPLCARRAVEADLDARMFGVADKAAMFDTVERARGRFAALIGAHPDEVAVTKNISEGLNIIAASYPWRPHDTVVVCAEREHPNNVYPWLHLRRTRGVDVRIVASEDGRISADRVVAAIDGSTRIVTASTVSFVPGLRTDLDAIGAQCRAQDILLLADAAQSAGILDLDVRKTPVDAVACSTQKGLLGLYGMGLLYCRRDWAERLEPAYLARFGVQLGDAHEADLGAFDYRLMPAARRFDLGNYNFTAAAALDEALKLLGDIGIPRIEQYVTGLSRSLATGLLELDLPIAGDPFGPEFANIVTIQDGQACAGRMDGLAAHFAENRIKFSIRQGSIRLSCHLYNDMQDVEKTVESAREWKRAVGA